MKALVTGGAGFIGSTLVDRLLAEGHAVDVVDNLATGSLANLAEARRSGVGHLTFHQIDVRSPDLAELVNRCRPEVVFHLAAQVDVRVSVADPLYRRRRQRDGLPAGPRGGPLERRPQGGVRLQWRDDLREPGSGRPPGQRVTSATARSRPTG